MACRSASRAQKARNELLQFFDSHIQRLQSTADYDGHAEEFKKNLSIEVEYVDLASTKTVLQFAKRVNQKYVFLVVSLITLIYEPPSGILISPT
jgi:3-keto steroid reductase